MSWTFLALGMTVLMGGLIAYNGDLIGRKYGKRRVTLFGLRPKHTAILITSITGVFISALTTGVLFLLVKPVRTIIMEGEDAIREMPRLTAQNHGLEQSNGFLRQQNEQGRSELVQKRTALTAAQCDLDKARANVRTANKELIAKKGQLATAERARDSALREKQQLTAHNKMLSSSNMDLAKANVDLNEQKTGMEKKLATLNEEVKRQELRFVELQKKNNDLQTKNVEYDHQNAELSVQNESLTRQNGVLLTVNNRLRDDYSSLDTKNRNLEQKNWVLDTAIRRLEAQANLDLNSLLNMVKTIRTRRVVVHGGEDLARRVVPAGATSEQVRAVIKELVHDANESALAKGAGSSQGGSLRAVQVVNKQFLTASETGNAIPVEVSETDRTNAMVTRLSGSEMPVCLLAIAVENSVEGEPATIDFQPFNDRLIYPKGRVVASPRRLNAGEPPARVYADLLSFLHDLGQSAVERGMIPRIDPATGSPQVGSLEWPELVDLADKVRAYGRMVKVTAIAAADTPASGPLKLDFKIDPSL